MTHYILCRYSTLWRGGGGGGNRCYSRTACSLISKSVERLSWIGWVGGGGRGLKKMPHSSTRSLSEGLQKGVETPDQRCTDSLMHIVQV